jgi:hypothetical protein
MKNKETLKEMNTVQLREINGGGFAFDVGRVLRFFALSGGGSPQGLAYALTDWQVNAMINEDVNN